MKGSAGGVPLRLPDFQGPAWMHEEQNAEQAGVFGVLPENWDAAQAFFACATQWRFDSRNLSDGRKVRLLSGLRYDAVQIVIGHGKFDDPADVFHRVQAMERAAVEQSRRMAPK